MPHKASNSFFDKKKKWSRRKDAILDYYLTPYLQKIKDVRKDIIIYDCFAGPGRYGDGEIGSPLIIAKKIVESGINAVTSRDTPKVSLVCIESDRENFLKLEENLHDFTFTSCRNLGFLDVIDSIEKDARNHSVFLYIDPYTISDLDWSALSNVFQHVNTSGSSIEILLNFNSDSFCRQARAALLLPQPTLNIDDCEDEWSDAVSLAEIEASPYVSKLNGIAGGDWWQSIIKAKHAYPEEVQKLTSEYQQHLRQFFAEAVGTPIKSDWRHSVPKYSLIFATRYPLALELINDAVSSCIRNWIHSELEDEGTLPNLDTNSMVPSDLQSDLSSIKDEIREYVRDTSHERNDIAIWIVRHHLGKFKYSEINRYINKLCAEGILEASNKRIGPNTKISASLFT